MFPWLQCLEWVVRMLFLRGVRIVVQDGYQGSENDIDSEVYAFSFHVYKSWLWTPLHVERRCTSSRLHDAFYGPHINMGIVDSALFVPS